MEGRRVVAHESGLFVFQGSSYAGQPLTYVQGKAEWGQINWNAGANELEVRVDTLRRLILVKAPLGSTQANANKILVWDYTNGLEADSVKFSIWDIDSGAWEIGGVEFVQSSLTGRLELWLAKKTAGEVLRIKNPDLPADAGAGFFSDVGRGINSIYNTSVFRYAEEVRTWIAARLTVVGAGTLAIWWRAYNGKRFVRLADATLSAANAPVVRTGHMQSQSASLKIWNGAVAGNWFKLSRAQAKPKEVWSQEVG
jgi:hypothetical protein